MKRQEVGRVSVRAHIVLLSSRGHSASEIAEIHDVTGPMVYKWMDRFDEEGPSGLYDRGREGRPRKITDEVEEETERLLEGNPTEEGKTLHAGRRVGLPNTSNGNSMSTSIRKRFATRWTDWNTARPVQGGSCPRPTQKPIRSGFRPS